MTQFYFKESRLFLNAADEFVVRLVSYSWYVLLAITTVILFFSGAESLSWFGALLALFLIDRLVHAGEGERDLNELAGMKVANIAKALTPSSIRVLSHAFRRTKMTGQDFYFLLLEALIEKKDIRETLSRLDVNPELFQKKIQGLTQNAPKEPATSQVDLLQKIAALALLAYQSAVDGNERFIDTRNILVALVSSPNVPREVQSILDSFNVNTKDLQAAAIFGRWRRLLGRVRFLPASIGGFANRPHFLRHRVMNRAWTARPTPILDKFTTDLTDLAREEAVGLLVGHGEEFRNLLQVISRSGKPNAILVGEPGAGKSSIIAHLAFRMIKDQVPSVLFDKRLVSLEIGALIADAPPEVLSGRLKTIAEEILSAGNIVLYIPSIHDLFRTSQKAGLNPIDIIFPIIKAEAIPVIGETYPREYKEYVEPRSDFVDQFEMVRVNEINEDDAVKVLIYESLILEGQYKVFISFLAIRQAVTLAHRYFHNKLLPGSALDLLKQALAQASEDKKKKVAADDVIAIAERLSRIPIQEAGNEETEQLLNLETKIHERLIGQDDAVRAVAQAIREYRSGLSRKGGPIATFLFVGPTGVGKTELAKILAGIQFGSKDAMERFDMSEYQEKTSIAQFIGSPDGKNTGALTDAVFEHPYSLILLDEFEKAHPDLLNLFLPVFDDGRLTDSLGRVVDFTNTIIIATSNAHSEFIKSSIEAGRSSEVIGEELKKKLTDYFKPELLNRFSGIIVFRSLSQDETYSITKLLIRELATTLKQGNGLWLECDDAALRELARLGYDPAFGARPLREVISNRLKSVLAKKILQKEVQRGDSIFVTFQNGSFDFSTNPGTRRK